MSNDHKLPNYVMVYRTRSAEEKVEPWCVDCVACDYLETAENHWRAMMISKFHIMDCQAAQICRERDAYREAGISSVAKLLEEIELLNATIKKLREERA